MSVRCVAAAPAAETAVAGAATSARPAGEPRRWRIWEQTAARRWLECSTRLRRAGQPSRIPKVPSSQPGSTEFGNWAGRHPPQLPVMLGLSSSLDLMRKPGYPRSHSSREAEQRLEDTDHMREAPGRCWSDRQTWLNKSCCDNCASSGVWGEYIHIPVCRWDSICPEL